MKPATPRTTLFVIVFLAALSLPAAQHATVKRNVNLRSDPSKNNPAIELLQADSTLTVLDPTPQNGYYHVKTGDGQEGWVWGRNISLRAETGEPSTPSPSLPPKQPTPPSGAKAGPTELYPDPARTPGVANPDITQDNIADNICNTNWSTKSIRPPVSYTNPLKRQQM